MRKYIAATLVLVIAIAVATADEFVGFITKFEDGKVSVKKSKASESPEEVTLKVADNIKIFRGKVNLNTKKIEASEPFEGGKDALAKQVEENAERVKKYIEQGKKGFGVGVFASIVTEDDKVTEIRVTGVGKKKQSK